MQGVSSQDSKLSLELSIQQKPWSYMRLNQGNIITHTIFP